MSGKVTIAISSDANRRIFKKKLVLEEKLKGHVSMAKALDSIFEDFDEALKIIEDEGIQTAEEFLKSCKR